MIPGSPVLWLVLASLLDYESSRNFLMICLVLGQVPLYPSCCFKPKFLFCAPEQMNLLMVLQYYSSHCIHRVRGGDSFCLHFSAILYVVFIRSQFFRRNCSMYKCTSGMSMEEGRSGSFYVAIGPELPKNMLKSTKLKKLCFI